ncbi:MAG: hypothetical protein DDT37_00075 [Firmicutes bacterium]|nr:hypothetical protein [candidate division NPL-UPA2 bacterium]
MPDSRPPKTKTLPTLFFIHLLLFPLAVLFWGMGYVSLAHHRYQGVLYEITALLAPHHWHQDDIFPNQLFHLGANALFVPAVEYPAIGEPIDIRRDHLLIFCQGTLEENLRARQPPEAVSRLVWVEGVEHSGNELPTLIAWGASDVQGFWTHVGFTPEPRSFRGLARFSQRIYNIGDLWLVFYNFQDKSGVYLRPDYHGIMHTTSPHPASVWLLGSLQRVSWGWEGERLSSTDILERLRPYQPGVMPIGYRLRVLRAAPNDLEIFWPLWPFPAPTGGSGIWEYSWMVLVPLQVVVTPYRYLFYLPLVLAPRILVWPVAVLWALLLLGSWVWCFALWRRLAGQSQCH